VCEDGSGRRFWLGGARRAESELKSRVVQCKGHVRTGNRGNLVMM
jgi:hypothetical protein